MPNKGAVVVSAHWEPRVGWAFVIGLANLMTLVFGGGTIYARFDTKLTTLEELVKEQKQLLAGVDRRTNEQALDITQLQTVLKVSRRTRFTD